MKLFIGTCILLWLSMSSVRSVYEPTQSDMTLLWIIDAHIQELELWEIDAISTISFQAKSRFDEDSRKWWFADSIHDSLWTHYTSLDRQPMLPVEEGDTIKVHYIGSLLDGSIFDTSIEDVAKEARLYNPARPYTPLEFTVWDGEMIAGFDSWVVGMLHWSSKTLTIPPEEAYGTSGSHFLVGETLIFEVTIIEIE